jgi:hypothetical protein
MRQPARQKALTCTYFLPSGELPSLYTCITRTPAASHCGTRSWYAVDPVKQREGSKAISALGAQTWRCRQPSTAIA